MNFDDPDDPTNSDSSHRRLPPTPSSSSSPSVKYRECLKNHAVTIGGHAVDGCGEFLPAASDNSIDSLRCAACNCHRNFHRRETSTSDHGSHQLPHFSPYYRTATAPSGYLHYPRAGPPLQQIPPALALPSSSGGPHEESASEERNVDTLGPGSGSGGDGSSMRARGRKRFRTKFTPEQKDRMLDLAERLGWRIQKHDEAAVQEFCNETGIKRHVLKVWMHNNKHSLGKKPLELPRVPDGGGGAGSGSGGGGGGGAVGFQ